MRSPQTFQFLLITGTLMVSGMLARADEAGTRYFENHIRPILVTHCYECHSEEAGKRKGGLWLDRKAGWELGGDSGSALIPGDPEQSLLVQLVRYEDPDLEMPPKSKLSDDQIAKLESWIQMGAPDPRTEAGIASRKGIDLEKGREFWSFQPIRDPQPPVTQKTDWALGTIDAFILAKLEAEGLTPAPDADPESLLRRVTLALTGLPPTLEEQDAFLANPTRDAFADVVDRLLDSKAFAERWGRHWLDITRYSDSSGGGRAIPLPDAWRFRDYVIASFEEDKPLDELIREHIAGDLLPYDSPEEQMEQLAGTGFLVLGPHNYENQDKEMLDLEIVDEQLDTIGRAFLGMTIGCARCHDHKFDPVPTSDYYAMAGIFTSTHSVNHSNVSKWVTRPYLASEEQQAELTAYDKSAKKLNREIASLKDQLKEMGHMPGSKSGKSIPLRQLPGIVIDNADAELIGEWQESSSTPHFVGPHYLHDQDQQKGEKAVIYRFEVPSAGLYEVRLSYSPNNNRARHVPVTVSQGERTWEFRVDQQDVPEHDGLFETLGKLPLQAKAEVQVRIGTQGAFGHVIADAVQVLAEGDAQAPTPKPSSVTKETVVELEAALKNAEEELKKLNKDKPKIPTLMSVAEAEEIGPTQIRIRGVTRNLGPEVPRGFLQVAWTGDGPPPTIPQDQSGRLALADWIASADNPLTARVLANRIWLHLFGEGIVPSPDNFGTTGMAPSHPELLDHLATRLIENEWSARALIREIVLSRSWSMASESPQAELASAVDPENRLLWKYPRRRIDAEALRDSILTLAGTLDPAQGGPSLPPGFKSEFGYQFTSMKRSVYIPVFRNQLHEIFGAFDFANPNFVVGKRSESTITTQALFFMNSPFMHEQSMAAGRRLLESTPKSAPAERIRRAYREVLCREPSPQEVTLSQQFLEAETAQSDALTAWSGLMRGLFSCVDFQYVP